MSPISSRNAFTLLEVMIAAGLIAMTMGSIVAMNARALQTLRESRQASAASQVLQQRVESIRCRNWSEVTSTSAILALMGRATPSEAELADPDMRESLTVTVPAPSPQGPTETSRTFTVTRERRKCTASVAADFSAEPTLLFQGDITWHVGGRVLTRRLRTIVCSQGLTRNGLMGAALGRPGTERPNP